MKLKLVIGGIIIIAAAIFGVMSFVETNVEYMDFTKAMSVKKKVQVKGIWQKEKETIYDANKREFSFYLKDDNGVEQRVIYSGAHPNNFEIADAIVVKGKYEDGAFRATEILTKCPSKYEAKSDTKNSGM